MEEKLLSSKLKENINRISKNVPSNFNFIKRELVLKENTECVLLYISGLVKQEYIEDSIIYPLLFKVDSNINLFKNTAEIVAKKYISSSDVEITRDIEKISSQIKQGKCVILFDKCEYAVICNTTGAQHRAITESQAEKSLKGGREAFVENLQVNIGLVQNKLMNDHLKMDNYVFGEQNQMQAVLFYVDNIIDPEILNNIKDKLDSIKTSYVPDTGYVTQIIENFPYVLFPQTKRTEKPDKVVSDLLQGKAALIISGAPNALIMPAVFIEFFQGFEDYANRILLGNFDRLLRFIAMIIILTFSPIYLALLNYNSELIPLPLIKLIADSRMGIPLPPFFEILIMELIIDVLREGGLRLPTPIGQTLAIVGGIVLGESATQAGIVSHTTLVVIATVVIATFVIPNYDMALGIRILRYFMLIMAALLGLYGVIMGLYIIFVTLIKMDSFGVPYFAPFAPLRYKDLKDSVLRGPIEYLNRFPVIFNLSKGKEKKDEN